MSLGLRPAVLRWDEALFAKINGEWTAPALDAVMPVLTDLHKEKWFVYGAALALGWWVWNGRREALKVLVVIALAIGMADFVNHRLFKQLVKRPRPEKAGVAVVLRTPSHAGWSFPSNHAMNMGAGAASLSYAYPAWAPAFWLGALLVAYSRVYCGVHFPADVFVGLVLGGLLGRLVAYLLLGEGPVRGAGRKKKRQKP
jgi:undecaprenyl-diphosphatase